MDFKFKPSLKGKQPKEKNRGQQSKIDEGFQVNSSQISNHKSLTTHPDPDQIQSSNVPSAQRHNVHSSDNLPNINEKAATNNDDNWDMVIEIPTRVAQFTISKGNVWYRKR